MYVLCVISKDASTFWQSHSPFSFFQPPWDRLPPRCTLTQNQQRCVRHHTNRMLYSMRSNLRVFPLFLVLNANQQHLNLFNLLFFKRWQASIILSWGILQWLRAVLGIFYPVVWEFEDISVFHLSLPIFGLFWFVWVFFYISSSSKWATG